MKPDDNKSLFEPTQVLRVGDSGIEVVTEMKLSARGLAIVQQAFEPERDWADWLADRGW